MDWDKYFMAFAKVASLKSKDPSTKVGAVIVDQNNNIISTGFNGPARNVNDNEINFQKSDDYWNSKYPWIIHAEQNAIINASESKTSIKGCKIYVTLFPCNECAKLIIQAGIKEIFYIDKKNDKSEEFSAIYFDKANVKMTEIKPFTLGI